MTNPAPIDLIKFRLVPLSGDLVDPNCIHCAIMRALLAVRPEGEFSGTEIIQAFATCFRDLTLAADCGESTARAALEFVMLFAEELLDEISVADEEPAAP